ncbi:hypothetical protein ACGF12_36440 [Kitasatospora sp. NPDC048296]
MPNAEVPYAAYRPAPNSRPLPVTAELSEASVGDVDRLAAL